MKKSLIAIIMIFIITILIVTLLPGTSKSYIKQGELYISKILASNSSLKEDNNGEYSDYIEIYNGYSFNVNLEGYHLSDSEFITAKWTFPDITIKPKESLIVYASGNDVCDIVNRVCHTNFKLSSKGEVLTLSDNHGNIISKITFPEQYPDIYYGYLKGSYTYMSKDGKPVYENKKSSKNYKLEINEYMTHNKRAHHDRYGNYYDFVEIYNPTSSDYTLEGVYLSDDATNLTKFQIPKVTILKEDYLVIYLADSNVTYDTGIYANFKLSDDDEEIIISNGEKIIDKVSIVKLIDDMSYGKTKDGWRCFTTPTPGNANNTTSFKTWGGKDGSS